MALNNSQYDELLRHYQATQLKNRRLQEERSKNAYLKFPELKGIDDAIAETSVAQAKKLLDGDTHAITELKAKLSDLRARKESILVSAGLPKNYFDPIYTCPDCQDTGFIDGKRCHCFLQASIDLVYTQSNLKKVLAKENFQTFSFDYYSDIEVNPTTGLSSLATAKQAVALCKHFIDTFDQEFSNLLFYGDTGIGKTFLSNCVAKELLDSGHSVIYFTAFQLFDILSKNVFEKDADAIAANQNIFDCDLLIIDDLGTELANSFTTSQLFLCLNERILRQKSTLISTNLNMNQIADIYSERVLSRISSSYKIIKLFGDDIRMKKRLH